MKTQIVTKHERRLIELYEAKQEAAKEYAEAVQFTAQEAETTPAVVGKYIRALASEKANEVIKETEQLQQLFLALPTLTATEQVA